MAPVHLRPHFSRHRPRPDRVWIFGGVVLLHLAVLALLLTYRIMLPEAPDGPVIRLESAPVVQRPATNAAAALTPITVPNPEPDVAVEQDSRRALRPSPRRPPEAVIAEEILTPSVAANTLGARGFDLMSPPTYAAPYLQNRMPDYPPAARRAGEAGTVVLRVMVSPQGRGQAAEIHRSSGYARLDEAARRAVLRWSYIPAERGRRPVASWTLVPIRFLAGGAVMLDEDRLIGG